MTYDCKPLFRSAMGLDSLARVMDILQTATAPRKVSAPVPVAA